MLFHSHQTGRVGLGHDRSVRHDVLRDYSGSHAGLFAGYSRGNPAMMAPPWMRQDGLRTVATILASITACRAGGMASQPPILMLVRLCHVVGGKRHVIVVKVGGVDFRELAQQRFPDAGDLGHVPVAGGGVHYLHLRVFLDHLPEAARAALRTAVASVSMAMTGVPALIIFSTGSVRVSMANAWIATKSQF